MCSCGLHLQKYSWCQHRLLGCTTWPDLLPVGGTLGCDEFWASGTAVVSCDAKLIKASASAVYLHVISCCQQLVRLWLLFAAQASTHNMHAVRCMCTQPISMRHTKCHSKPQLKFTTGSPACLLLFSSHPDGVVYSVVAYFCQ